MKPFSDENFELKVYLKYIIDKAKDNRPKKCIMDYLKEENIEELEKFVDRYEFTYVNLKRLATTDQELIPLMHEFLELFERVDSVVDRHLEEEKESYIKEQKNKMKVYKIEEGNDNNE